MPFWKRNIRVATVEVYEDASGKWRWRSVAKNGKVVDASEQGYSTKRYAIGKAERYAENYDLPVSVATD